MNVYFSIHLAHYKRTIFPFSTMVLYQNILQIVQYKNYVFEIPHNLYITT